MLNRFDSKPLTHSKKLERYCRSWLSRSSAPSGTGGSCASSPSKCNGGFRPSGKESVSSAVPPTRGTNRRDGQKKKKGLHPNGSCPPGRDIGPVRSAQSIPAGSVVPRRVARARERRAQDQMRRATAHQAEREVKPPPAMCRSATRVVRWRESKRERGCECVCGCVCMCVVWCGVGGWV